MRLPMPGRPWFTSIALAAACRAGDGAPREPAAAAAEVRVLLKNRYVVTFFCE